MTESFESDQNPYYKNQKLFHILLWSFTTLMFVWYTYISWTQYYSTRVYLIDGGMFDFVLSGFRHGHFMRYPLAWEENVSYFAAHFRPIFIVISLFYFIADHAMMMLTVFNACLVFAAIPLGLLARKILRHDLLAFVMVGLYLTNVYTRSIHLSVHPEALSPLGFFLLFLAVENKNKWMLWGSLIFLFSIKEDMPLYTGAFALTMFFDKDDWMRKNAVYILISSVVVFIFALTTIELAGAEKLVTADVKPLEKFSNMGDTKLEILFYVFTHPIEIAGKIFKPALFYLFLSTGFLALLDWKRFWIILFAASIFLIVESPTVGHLHYYYSYAALPFVFYCGINGLYFLQTKLNNVTILHRTVIVLFAIMAVVQSFFLTRTDYRPHWPFKYDEKMLILSDIINLIPDDADVCVQYALYAKVPNRPVKLELASKNLPYAEYVLFDEYGINRSDDVETYRINTIISSDEFKLVHHVAGYGLLQRVKEPNLSRYSVLPPDETVRQEDDPPIEYELDDEGNRLDE